MRKLAAWILAIMLCVGMMATGTAEDATQSLSLIDMTKWQYEASDDVYWQAGLSYAANPADESYETMGIFVPGAYFTAAANGDGTYTCAVNAEGAVGLYTASTAPYILPVNTPGYAAMAAPTGYSSSMGYGSISDYTSAGIIVLFAGARGRDAGAPAGVVDFKAAIRYARYNADLLPGDLDSIFSLGMSGGGAQSSLIGSTGDSDLYTPYLDAIGAVMETSDAVKGSMCWCPITNLDQADEAYEWNMGVTRSGLSEEEQAYSDGMAAEFAEYINAAGFVDENGNALTLVESEDGIYQAGSYYDYIKQVIETSLAHFLADNEFPYTASSSSGRMGGMGGRGGMGGGQRPDGNFGGFGGQKPDGDFQGFDGQMPEGDFPGFDGESTDETVAFLQFASDGQEDQDAQGFDGQMPEGDFPAPDGQAPEEFATLQFASDAQDDQNTQTDYEAMDGITRTETGASTALSLSGTYETKQDYIDALNANGEWVSWDESTGEVTITSVSAFVSALKNASKSIAAFDQLDRGQGENTLFGYGDGSGAHFDAILAGLVQGSEYEAAFGEDLSKEDAVGSTVDVRLKMYTPLYYLLASSEGYQSANVAKYWRIRTGINQGDTALCTEVNLALALDAYSEETQVDFETVWGQGHTEAERAGSSTENFITWVNECMAQE